jgi:hypothetical protein
MEYTNDITVNIICHMCSALTTFNVPRDGYQAWQEGTLIQKALPGLSPSQRELLISGTCDTCFDKLFAEEDEED